MSLTNFFLLVTIGISVLGFSNAQITERFMFSAFAIKHHKQWWRFFSHGLIHANIPHLAFNMIALYSFGRMVEMYYVDLYGSTKGELFFFVLYAIGLFASSAFDYSRHQDHSWYKALGASGAVSAVMYAAILINPMGGIYLMFIPIAIPAWIFGILYLIYSSYMAKRGSDNIGHDAHFWGAVYGFMLTWVLDPTLFRTFIHSITSFFTGNH
jgi:membrane associated rhomboid family serine protease